MTLNEINRRLARMNAADQARKDRENDPEPDTFRRIGEITRGAAEALGKTRAAQIMEAAQELDPLPDDPDAEARFREMEIEFDADPELLGIIRRIKRRAEVMRLDAGRGTTARQDAEEIRILAEMAEKRLGVING